MIYDLSMKSETYPLNMPADLLGIVRKVAKKTGLSMADTMRQSMKLGLPTLEKELSTEEHLKTLKPFTAEECEQCWGKPDPEFDALAAAMTSRKYSPSKEDLD